MSETLIDIYNNIIEYDGIEITVIVDNKNIPWFNAAAISNILDYKNPNKAIIMHVNDDYKKTFEELKEFIKKIPKNMQPHAIYINEFGLNSLILGSKMPKARLFKRWIIEKVLPSIAKTGTYIVEDKNKILIDELHRKLKFYKKEVKILKHNQKKCKYGKGGKIYIFRPIDTRNPKLLKTGMTECMDERLGTLNTTVPDDVEVLFTLETDDPESVEICVKSFMKKYIYRKNKEYYECTTKKLRDNIIKCGKIVKGEFYCDKCQKRIDNIDNLINHANDYHDITTNENLYLDMDINQSGGNNILLDDMNVDNYQMKYLKYKIKYLLQKRDRLTIQLN